MCVCVCVCPEDTCTSCVTRCSHRSRKRNSFLHDCSHYNGTKLWRRMQPIGLHNNDLTYFVIFWTQKRGRDHSARFNCGWINWKSHSKKKIEFEFMSVSLERATQSLIIRCRTGYDQASGHMYVHFRYELVRHAKSQGVRCSMKDQHLRSRRRIIINWDYCIH